MVTGLGQHIVVVEFFTFFRCWARFVNSFVQSNNQLIGQINCFAVRALLVALFFDGTVLNSRGIPFPRRKYHPTISWHSLSPSFPFTTAILGDSLRRVANPHQ